MGRRRDEDGIWATMDDFELRTRRARLKELILAGEWLYRDDPRRAAKIERLLEIAGAADVNMAGEWLSSLQRQRAIVGEIDAKAETSQEIANLQATLDRFIFGVVLLSAAGDLLFVNAGFRDLAARIDGIAIKTARLSFTGELSPVADALRLVARGRRAKRTLSISLAAGETLIGHVFVLGQPALADGAGEGSARQVLLILSDLANLLDVAKIAAPMYGLTEKETELLQQLVAGSNLRQAAENCGIARNTARNHLSNIFQKTGVSRQADLIRVAMQFPWK